MAKERALTLEALRVLDAIERRGSFAAAADELSKVPSALSYTIQKMEEELDLPILDRSGHRTRFTNVGYMLLERGRLLLEAAHQLTADAEELARGWEPHLTIITESVVPSPRLFPMIEKLADVAQTQLSMITEVLSGAWECLEQGRADIIIAPNIQLRASPEIKTQRLYSEKIMSVAAPNHPILLEDEPMSKGTREKYRGIAIADTARERPVTTLQVLDKQSCLTLSTNEEKRQALLAGLGVGIMPWSLIEQDVAEGKLRVIHPEEVYRLDIVMAWRRDSMGEAKSWCLREIPRLLGADTVIAA